MFISLQELLTALQEQGLDEVYLKLERLFREEPLAIVVNHEGEAISFLDEQDIFDYLEYLYVQERLEQEDS